MKKFTFTNNMKSPAKMISIMSILLVFLLSTTSCSRNVGTGCGAWPSAKYNKTKYGHESVSYRRYNS